MIITKHTMDVIHRDWEGSIKYRFLQIPKGKTRLTMLSYGNDDASMVYLNNKMKACRRIGIPYAHVWRPTIHGDDVIKYDISKYCEDGHHSVMVQMPLPSDKHNIDDIVNSIPITSDVDGMNPQNPYVIAPVANGVRQIINRLNRVNIECITNIEIYPGDIALVIGRSRWVGQPIAKMLSDDYDFTVVQANSNTTERELASMVSMAKVIVSCAGQRGIINDEMVKEVPPRGRSLIVDVGTNRDDNGKLCGDVTLSDSSPLLVTPVPGGVGPMTVLGLMDNVVRLANVNREKEI